MITLEKETKMTRPPKGFTDISTTYQLAYMTLSGNVQARKIRAHLWEVMAPGDTAVIYETSQKAALARALQLSSVRRAALSKTRKKTRGPGRRG